MDDARPIATTPNTPNDRLRQFAWLLWIVLIAGTIGRALAYHHPKHRGIYASYAAAGRHWFAGEDLYPTEYGNNAFTYSPLIGAAMVPFGWLPDVLGSAIWRAFIAALFAGALWRFGRVAFAPALDSPQRTILFLLVIPFVGSTFVNAQAGAIVSALVILALADANQERWTRAAVLAALAGMIKVYPLAVGLSLSVAFPRRFGWRFPIAILGCIALPFLIQSPAYALAQYQSWLKLIQQASHHPWYLTEFNHDLNFLIARYLWPISPSAYRITELIAAGSVAWLVHACRRAGESTTQLITTVGALSACWMTLFGPGTETFTYALLGAPLGARLIQHDNGRISQLVLRLSWLCFAVAAVAIWFPFGRSFHKLGPHPIGGLLFMGVVLNDVLARLAKTRLPESTPATRFVRAA